ncbi:MAG: hypothetical protein WCW77_03800 [Patescibacteria group bacterium]|jgi:hypothetical protein
MQRRTAKIAIIILLAVLLAGPAEVALSAQSQGESSVFLTVEEHEETEEPEPTPTPQPIILPEFFGDIELSAPYVRTGTDEAVINWSANKPVRCALKWGDDQELKNGVIENPELKNAHRALLSGLNPGADYYYQIECKDSFNRKKSTQIYGFTTLGLKDEKAPANPSDFTAIYESGAIRLNWKNPEDPDFRAVKITRSDEFYPQAINEGADVYNDSGESAIDRNVIPGKRYYYTIFAYDNNFNYSSGAIASARVPKPGEPIVRPGEEGEAGEEGEVPGKEGEIVPMPPAPPAPPEERFGIALSDFIFSVANETIEVNLEESNTLLPGTLLDVKTPSERYPKVLKSIIMAFIPKAGIASSTIAERKKEARSYLLKINNENKYYQANFPLPLKVKDYDIRLYFLNYNNSRLAETGGEFKIENFGQVISSGKDAQDAISFLPGSFRGAWPQIFSTALAQSQNGEADPVYTAEISLYQYENGEFKKWRGEKYSQFNPLYSNKKGQYGFLAPDGTYMIKARKDNYYAYQSLPFEVKNNIVNKDINLIYYPKSNPKKYLLIVIAIIIFFLAADRVRRKNKKRRLPAA